MNDARAASFQALPAVAQREARTTLHNRFVQVFALVLVGGSLAASVFVTSAASLPFAVLMLFLYVVPLFGLLTGVSAAHEERAEWPFLMSQPVRRFTFALGKGAALVVAFAVVLVAALLPVAWSTASAVPIGAVGGLGLALVLVGVSVGLALGYYTKSRARGLMSALLVWFAALALYDLLALGLSGIDFFQRQPALWVAVLLLNPLDAVRLAGLLALEAVPFSLPGEDASAAYLLQALPAWVVVVTLAWTGLALWLTYRRLEHRDL